MHQFTAKSNLILSILSILALLGLFAVENGKIPVRKKWYREKLAAARLARQAARYIREQRLQQGVFVDEVNDPNQTALIGQEYTLITTDRGSIESKLSATNPNYAAVIVEMLHKAGLKEGQVVAVALTGSFPGMNIALYAALETLGLRPVVITSVGASNWGATDPYFTWLDMEKILADAGIFRTRSVAASIGGGMDIGRGLSPKGRQLILEAINRNGVDMIREKHLEKSIERRMKIYDQKSGKKKIAAYINVGGGIASLGSTLNGRLIPAGLTKKLPMKNFPVRGVIIQMATRNIPIIHLLNISRLNQKFGMPASPVPLPEPGEGAIFENLKYDLKIAIIVAAMLSLAIALVYFGEKKRHRLGTEPVPVSKARITSEEI